MNSVYVSFFVCFPQTHAVSLTKIKWVRISIGTLFMRMNTGGNGGNVCAAIWEDLFQWLSPTIWISDATVDVEVQSFARDRGIIWCLGLFGYYGAAS